ncbi:hypothetical protein JHK85_040751 [Glycine max]|nr:hypothetical protein JHK86_040167 [Glycine max]KAG4965776.1 hypothetical protein JHK85_040751 [Glycine max]
MGDMVWTQLKAHWGSSSFKNKIFRQRDSSLASDESRIEPQTLFSKPIRIVETYPSSERGDLKKKHMVCLNWLLSE